MRTTPAALRDPRLDVIRGVAIALVLVGHSGFGYAAPVGVTLFFVLSGYLITRLLVEERRRTGRTDWRAFYRRRIARLAPALLAVVAFVSVAAYVRHDGHSLLGALVSLTYVGNWVAAAGNNLGAMSHTWSLAVEEQFYIVWPVVFIALWPRLSGRLAIVLVAVAAVIVATRFVVPLAAEGGERATHLRADALLLGCALGLHAWRPPRVLVLASIGILAILSSTFWTNDAAGYALAGIASLGLVAGSERFEAGIGSMPMLGLARLGRISYGAYLWHLPIFLAIDGGILGIITTIAIAEVSFRFFEEPLRLRFYPRRVAPVAPPTTSSVVNLPLTETMH